MKFTKEKEIQKIKLQETKEKEKVYKRDFVILKKKYIIY